MKCRERDGREERDGQKEDREKEREEGRVDKNFIHGL